jgi:small subunit ribosomal protein S15
MALFSLQKSGGVLTYPCLLHYFLAVLGFHGMAPGKLGQLNNDMLDKAKKEKLIKKYRTHDADTGSPQVQIAILTEEVKELTKHLKAHRKDFSSRRGLVKKVAERRRLLKYLEREDQAAHDALIADLGLKRQA